MRRKYLSPVTVEKRDTCLLPLVGQGEVVRQPERRPQRQREEGADAPRDVTTVRERACPRGSWKRRLPFATPV
jgi:hypothetical protein